ncbi:leucine-rich repeats and immunoglobulin-like domains protein 1 isoform X2 [Cyprinus carpio]|uniref:leucine-rich repeats and immunoglobulin-like domains protein 1 isoform X2 n=1 Tax=Cyprinus carpio TaxID=7962 RepID=UPI001C5770D6|nr:leucine-rich repeats and immunoglobulin-like domains protein 1 isoform X2 [Cyprinus carpio]XP_042588697.1 leucine-rich repeats and immunoglobulin-like domains protein 1 isoform X2 [Cyprinus carpio]
MWKREGLPILEKHRHSFSEKNQTLHISNITSSDYGTYSCIASNEYGESEKHTYISGENSSVNQGNGTRDKTQSDQTVLSSGLTLTCVLGLCIVFYCLYKYHHRQRAENGRTTDEGGAAIDLGIYQEIPGYEEVTPLPYVYTDFIKPKESGQASAAAHLEDFGYSEVGPACRERVSNEESTACPEAGEE